MADRVQRADAVRRDAEHLAHGGRGDQPHPQPGERAGTEPGDDRAQVGGAGVDVGEDRVDLRREQLAVRAGVDGAPLRARYDALRRDLDQRRGHRGGRGIHHQYEHGCHPNRPTGHPA
ncbi:hypothetical protein GCM10010429_22150 [Micromonospora olivasterospora]